MRPNIDLPWSVHGAIREYAEKEDASIEEAYCELLEQSLALHGLLEGTDHADGILVEKVDQIAREKVDQHLHREMDAILDAERQTEGKQ